MGKVRNSPAAQTRTFLIHFLPRTIGSATCEFDSKSKSKTESKAASDCRNSKRLSIACAERRQSHYGCFDFRRPHVALPLVLGRKWKKKRPCLSVASCGRFPFFDLHKREPEGQRLCVAFFCLHFLGEARKVSSYRATPGRQSPNNDKNTNKTKPQQTQTSMPPAHIFCAARRPIMLEEAHGICALALPVLKFHTA